MWFVSGIMRSSPVCEWFAVQIILLYHTIFFLVPKKVSNQKFLISYLSMTKLKTSNNYSHEHQMLNDVIISLIIKLYWKDIPNEISNSVSWWRIEQSRVADMYFLLLDEGHRDARSGWAGWAIKHPDLGKYVSEQNWFNHMNF